MTTFTDQLTEIGRGESLASKMVSTKRPLCKVDDLPSHLQFNKDILSGYRRPMSGWDCVRSWWEYVHNESFNCYSHGRLDNCLTT